MIANSIYWFIWRGSCLPPFTKNDFTIYDALMMEPQGGKRKIPRRCLLVCFRVWLFTLFRFADQHTRHRRHWLFTQSISVYLLAFTLPPLLRASHLDHPSDASPRLPLASVCRFTEAKYARAPCSDGCASDSHLYVPYTPCTLLTENHPRHRSVWVLVQQGLQADVP